MFGFLNVYKPKGKTSHDVVSILRRITKIKRIGHAGTLDPFAEGVLPVSIGKATRLIEYLDDNKAYVATVKFGEQTTTYDIEGEIINSSDKKISTIELQTALKLFEGEVSQIPPIYSAIKVNGKKLYEYARKGEDVEIKPRQVCIKSIKLLDFDETKQTAKIYVECSKGTYIRSLANDLGIEMNSFGYLTNLIRVKSGQFEVTNSIKLEQLQHIEDVTRNLIYPTDCITFPKYELTEFEKDKISHGMPIKTNLQDEILLLTYQEELIAVGSADDYYIKCLKVLI